MKTLIKFMMPMLLVSALTCVANAESGVNGRVIALQDNGVPSGMVAGAKIEFMDQSGAAIKEVTANEQGYYKVDLPPGRYLYKITADGYKDEDEGRGMELQLTDGYAVYNFSLSQGENDPDRKKPEYPKLVIGRLFGKVKSAEDDKGIENALITLVEEKTRELVEVIVRPSKTGEPGEYSVTLAEGAWQASVRAKGYEQLVDTRTSEISSGVEIERDFVLEPIGGSDEDHQQGIRGSVLVAKPDGLIAPPFETKIDFISTRDRDVVYSDQLKARIPKFEGTVLPGSYQVVASAPGSGFAKAVSKPLFVFPDRFTNVRLVMRAESDVPDQPTTEPEPQPDPSKLPIEVVVMEDRTKEPVAGAEVMMRDVSDSGRTILRETTDQSGKAHFTVEEGKYFVLARKAGYQVVRGAPEEHFIRGRLVLPITSSSENRAGFLLKPTKEPPTSENELVVEVFDDTSDSVIAGATVSLTADSHAHSAVTNSSGQVTFPDFAPDRYQLRVRRDGYMDVDRGYEHTVGRRIIRIPMHPTASDLIVEVYDAKHGTMLSDASISLLPPRGGIPRSATTDSSGRAAINGLAAGNYQLRVTREDYTQVVRSFDYTSGHPTVRVAMYRAADVPTLSISVTGAVMSEPDPAFGIRTIPGCRLTWTGTQERSVETDERGRYRVLLNQAGMYQVTVTPPADSIYEPAYYRVNVERSMEKGFHVSRRATTPGTSERTIRGTVMYQPPAGLMGYALIKGALLKWESAAGVRTATSGTNGQYQISLPNRAVTYKVTVTPPAGSDFLPLTETVTTTPGLTTKDFALKRRTSRARVDVKGWVVTSKSTSTPRFSPIPDWTNYQAVPNARVLVFFPNEGGLPGAVRAVTADSRGQFTVPDLPPQQYGFQVNQPGFQKLDQKKTVSLGMKPLWLVLTRSLTPGGLTPGGGPSELKSATLQIHVVDQTGQGVPKAQVDLKRATSSRVPPTTIASGVTDGKGYWQTQQSLGTYFVKVYGNQISQAGAQIQLTRNTTRQIQVRRQLQPSQSQRRLTVRVTDQKGAGWNGATVEIRTTANQLVRSLRTDSRGKCEAMVNAPATYLVKAIASGVSGGTTAQIGSTDVTAQIALRASQPSATPGTIRPTTGFVYVAQYVPPGSKDWKTIGTYQSRSEAESAVKLAKLPPRSKTRITTQRRGAPTVTPLRRTPTLRSNRRVN